MKNTIYSLVERNIPSYIKTLYPNTKNLILDFFKFLESDNNHIRLLLDFKDNTDIDNQIEPYIDYFLNELGWTYQHKITIDKRTLIIILKDLYLSRGSKKSFNCLFRILFDTSCEINYPRDNLFTLSNAPYTNDSIILISANNINNIILKDIINNVNFDIINIRGLKSKTVAVVNNMVVVFKKDIPYILVHIDIDDKEDFINLETVILSKNSYSIIETVYNTIGFNIVNSGNYYKKNDIINILGCDFIGLAKVNSISSGYINNINIIDGGLNYKIDDIITTTLVSKGQGFFASVKTINNIGSITGIKIYNTGSNFLEKPSLSIKSLDGAGAILDVDCINVGGIQEIEFVYPAWKSTENITYNISSVSGVGAELSIVKSSCKYLSKNFYLDTKGFLNTQHSIIHDSFIYQHFSYAINSSIPSNLYSSIVEDLLHPVGFVQCNTYCIETTAIILPTVLNTVIIGNKLLQEPNLNFNISNNTLIILELILQPTYMLPNTQNIDYLKLSDNFKYNANSFDEYSISIINRYNTELRTIDPELIQVIK